MSIHSVRDLLAAHPIFGGFDPAALDEIAGCATNAHFAPGQVIFREGDAAERVYVLRRGDVALEISAPGKASMTVETRHAGDVLGWGWLGPDHRAMVDARALTEVSAVGLDAGCVRRKCDAQPELGYRMLKTWLPRLAATVRAQRLRLLDLYGTDADRRA